MEINIEKLVSEIDFFNFILTYFFSSVNENQYYNKD